MYQKITLRGKIADAKAEYLEDYGYLDWHWYDEGLLWTIQDYHSSMRSILDFTVDDLCVCSENGFNLPEIIELCESDDLREFESCFDSCLEKYNQQADKPVESVVEIPLSYILGHMAWYYSGKMNAESLL